MAIGVNWAEIWQPVWKPVWVQSLTTVPDVVGETQAQGTTDIQAVGLVVAVQTAYSSTVAAGLIISQSPVGGAQVSPGSTVTITVSLGDQPASAERNAGGLWYSYELEQARRRKRKRDLERAQEEAERIQDETDREIALLMQERERRAEFQTGIERLKGIVAQFADREAEEAMAQRVRIALARAAAQQSVSALLALQRELDRMFEEEEVAIIMLLNEQ